MFAKVLLYEKAPSAETDNIVMDALRDAAGLVAIYFLGRDPEDQPTGGPSQRSSLAHEHAPLAIDIILFDSRENMNAGVERVVAALKGKKWTKPVSAAAYEVNNPLSLDRSPG